LPSESVAESFAAVEKATVPAESIATSFIKAGSSSQSESITSELISPKMAESTPASAVIAESTQEKPAVQADQSSVVSKGNQISPKEDSQKSEKTAAPGKPAEILDKEKTESTRKESTKPGFFSKIKSFFSGSDKNKSKSEESPVVESSKKSNLGEKFFGDKVGNVSREVLAKEFGLTADEKARVDAGLPLYPEESEEAESIADSSKELNVSSVLNATATYPTESSKESTVPSISEVINGKAISSSPNESSVESSPILILPVEEPEQIATSVDSGVSVKSAGVLSENAKNTLINPPNPIIPEIKNLSSTVESSSASMASTVAETVSSAMTASASQGSSQNSYNTVNNNSTGLINQAPGQNQVTQVSQPVDNSKSEQQTIGSDYYMRLLYEAIVTHGIKLRNI
jgi:hypothetical protein